MKNFCKFSLVVILLIVLETSIIGAQERGSGENANDSEFWLEEIMVTSEKREESIQEIPASVIAVSGEELTSLGKMTTAEVLEEMPGVDWNSSRDLIGSGHAQPDAGIKIRSITRKTTSDGQPPSAVATYVDGVFEGMGGNYDIERVEVLRGPQGTLYGRSATGGVAAFVTKDPQLTEFGGDMKLTVGEYELRNVEAAVNAPFGESFALRIATRYHTQDGYFNEAGGKEETKEARTKLLYYPTDKLRILLSGAVRFQRYNSGGCSQTFISPDEYDYCGSYEDVLLGNYNEMYQGTLQVDYDFGSSNLTYIGSYRYFEDTDNLQGSVRAYPNWTFRDLNYNPGEWFHTEEVRWVSDSDGWFSWLVGANYYYSKYDRTHGGEQVVAYEYPGGAEDHAPESRDAPVFDFAMAGHTYNLGFFTEETFKLSEKMRITAGLRYDMSEVMGDIGYRLNLNQTEFGNFLSPPMYIGTEYAKTLDWENITYKLRVEYDLTPENMIYAMTATGFLPGDVRISTHGANFIVLPYDEEKLTTYEVGSKNRFLDNRVQLNVSLFYYDYDEYRHTVNLATQQGVDYIIIVTPLEMFGAEAEFLWMVTKNDKVSMNLAWLDATIKDFPMIDAGAGPVDSREYLTLSDIPGTSPLTGFLRYEHTFHLAGGSTLVPRLTLRYSDGYYLNQLTQAMVDMGQLPYNYQDSYTTCDFGITWTSDDGKYSASAWVHNLTDEEYKLSAFISGTGTNTNVAYLGAPRNAGVNFSIRF